MEAKELRIGNLALRATGWSDNKPVIFSERPHAIDSLDLKYAGIHDFPDFDGCMDVEYKDLKGIELTEEWLIKFGFIPNKQKDEFTIQILNDSFMLDCEYTDKGVFDILVNDVCLPPDIKYVHQLQNILFILTGNELEIK